MTLGVVLGLGAVGLLSTWAIYSGTTVSTGNSAAAGTVILGDDDATAMSFNVSNLKPGQRVSKCIAVTYSGSLGARVKLYATAQTGTTLSPYLKTRVEEGSGGAFSSCAGFDAYRVAYGGTLSSFGSTKTAFSSGVGAFYARASGQVRTYRVTVTLDPAAPFSTNGTSASVNLRWEARNAAPSTTNPTFSAADLSTTRQYWRTVAADFNDDGRPDVAAGSTTSDTVDVWLATGPGTFGTVSSYGIGSNVRASATGDLDGDGDLDLALATESSNRIDLRFNDGAGAFPTSATVASSQATEVALADLDADGDLDLITANYLGNLVLRTFMNSGTGTFSVGEVITTGVTGGGIDAADLNGDGRADVAVALTGSVKIYLAGSGGTLGAPATYAISSVRGPWVRLIDLDSDGRRDLVSVQEPTATVRMNSGSGSFGAPTDTTIGNLGRDITSEDFNGDGVVDLAIDDQADGVSLLRNDGAGALTKTALANPGNVYGIATADFTDDGKPDLVYPDGSGLRLATNTTP